MQRHNLQINIQNVYDGCKSTFLRIGESPIYYKR
jgi:hypothetical protein